jgi:hypothetical protein
VRTNQWVSIAHLKTEKNGNPKPGVDEGAPGAEVLGSNDDVAEDNVIHFEIP